MTVLAIPLDERIVGVVQDVAPTVEDHDLETGDDGQLGVDGLEDIVEAVAVGREHIG